MSLLLSLTLVALGWRTLAGQREAAARLVRQMDVLSARRLAAVVVGRDLRRGVAQRDWMDPAGDSLALRVFRGWSLACPTSPRRSEGVDIAYRGARAPVPAKDSVLVLTGEGWVAADLVRRVRVDRSSCLKGLDSTAELWTLDPPVSGPLMRVFERGSYHISNRALRYRRGRGGRQPLTSLVFGESSAMTGTGDRVLIQLVAESPGIEGGVASADVSLWSGADASQARRP